MDSLCWSTSSWTLGQIFETFKLAGSTSGFWRRSGRTLLSARGWPTTELPAKLLLLLSLLLSLVVVVLCCSCCSDVFERMANYRTPSQVVVVLSLLLSLVVVVLCCSCCSFVLRRGPTIELPVKLLLLLSLLMLLLSCFVLLFCCFLKDGKLHYLSNELLTTFSCVG